VEDHAQQVHEHFSARVAPKGLAMNDDSIMKYSVADGGKCHGNEDRPPRPMFSEELAETLQNRPALNRPEDATIELDLAVSSVGDIEWNLEPVEVDGAFLTGRDDDELKRSTPWKLRVSVRNAALGVHALPPQAEIIQFEPEHDIRQAQQEFPEFEGLLPDHLPLRVSPRRLPEQLRVQRRVRNESEISDGVKDRPHDATTIFSPDDRYLFNDTAYPWCTVGRVDTPGGSGSGTMVGPRHLLTCSHVIQWNPGNTAGWVKFTPSYFDGSAPFGIAWGTRIYWEGTKVFGPSISRNEGQHDYVCVVLDRDIGNLTGWMGSRSWSDDWDDLAVWRHIGYPSDLSSMQRPSYQRDIALDGSFWDREVHSRIFHRGDVWPGQSGGPFFAWWPGESFPRMVADQSGQSSDENSASGGAHMVNCIIRARNDHP
jgi:V8-like Glu-specific endopeptidase